MHIHIYIQVLTCYPIYGAGRFRKSPRGLIVTARWHLRGGRYKIAIPIYCSKLPYDFILNGGGRKILIQVLRNFYITYCIQSAFCRAVWRFLK